MNKPFVGYFNNGIGIRTGHSQDCLRKMWVWSLVYFQKVINRRTLGAGRRTWERASTFPVPRNRISRVFFRWFAMFLREHAKFFFVDCLCGCEKITAIDLDSLHCFYYYFLLLLALIFKRCKNCNINGYWYYAIMK